MTREEIMQSTQLKKRFCKDCNIPIQIFQEPYFTDRLKLYDQFYGTLEKWERFVQTLQRYNNEQDYFEEYNRIKDDAIQSIKSSRQYQSFLEEDMNKFSVSHKGLPSKNIYKDDNVGKVFISIDMKKANFSSLRCYHPGIVDNADTWEAFISKFTDNQHIIYSKYIRQVILGNCNPKRQVTFEKHKMDTVLRSFETLGINEQIAFFSNDEIVYDVTGRIDVVKDVLWAKGIIEEATSIPLKLELFLLCKIENTDGYLKIFGANDSDVEFEFKCLNNYMLPFAMRHMLNEKVTDSDKTFYHEGLLSKFIEVPKIEIRGVI